MPLKAAFFGWIASHEQSKKVQTHFYELVLCKRSGKSMAHLLFYSEVARFFSYK